MNTEFDIQYPEYDIALKQIVKSKKDLEIVLYIKNMFIKKEIKISPIEISQKLKISSIKVSDIIIKMTKHNIIMVTEEFLIFRLNPYMIIPYGFNGAELQQEWDYILSKNTIQP